MLLYVLRRLGYTVITIFGVMLVTFLLFRCVPKDIAAAVKGPRATEEEKADWRHAHGFDKPMVVNIHRQLLITDKSGGKGGLTVKDSQAEGSVAASALGLFPYQPQGEQTGQGETPKEITQFSGRYVLGLDANTPLDELTYGHPLVGKGRAGNAQPVLACQLADGQKINIDLSGAKTAGELISKIDQASGGKLVASISDYHAAQFVDSQFLHHLWDCATFSGRSFTDKKKLTEIIAEKAPYSLAITVPAMALEFLLGMIVACFVAYYRSTWIDKLGVFLCVLAMCIPFLAYMIYMQRLVFWLSPKHAYGLFDPSNLYLPIAISVMAGLGGMVRFYRTIILDETTRDYVRTARAKGLPLTTILFKHVLKNCMLPILTGVVTSIPFLIMGNLLLEQFFGIPGLGDLMLTSINNANEPVMNSIVFLSSLAYTLGVLLTDIAYGVFDPRIRLS